MIIFNYFFLLNYYLKRFKIKKKKKSINIAPFTLTKAQKKKQFTKPSINVPADVDRKWIAQKLYHVYHIKNLNLIIL